MRGKRAVAPCILAALLALSACSSSSSPHSSGPSASSSPSSSGTARPTPAPVPSIKQPLIVQIENLWAARPQSGLSYADLVYEYETEGGISRFSAFYFHVPDKQIGPVRSARLVTLKLVRTYDATLFYSGSSAYVNWLLGHSGLRTVNEDEGHGTLYRVYSRYPPHNLYTDGAHLSGFMNHIGWRLVHYQLWARTPITALPPVPGEISLNSFSVPVTKSEQPIFTYVPALGAYRRTEPDTGTLNDADTGKPWTPVNIVVVQVRVTYGPEIEDEFGDRGLEFTIGGTGKGQLAVGGRLYPIRWYQPASGPLRLALPDGRPAPVAPGQVLIELVRTGLTVARR